MIGQINGMLEVALNDENLIPNAAKICRKVYDELIKEQFSPEQAIQIVTVFANKAGK